MNSILRRRRALMAQGESVIVFDGSKFDWQIGQINGNTGQAESSVTTYLNTTDFIPVKKPDYIVAYTGPQADANQVAYIVYVAEYSENYSFIVRYQLKSAAESLPRRYRSNCKYIKFMFGHASSSAVDMAVSDGAYFEAVATPVQSGRLPAEYQEVVWVGTNGDQTRANSVIETNYVPILDPKAEFSWAASSTGSRSSFAIYTSNTVYPAYEFYTVSGNIYYKWGNSTNNLGMNGVTTNTFYNIVAGISLIVNGSVRATKTATDWSANTKSVKLFYGSSNNINAKFTEFMLYDGDTLVRDLVPCYRLSDLRPGFYCLKTNLFYTNAGAANVLTNGGAVV